LPQLLADHEHTRTVVLASGDPLVAGIGTTLVELFGPTAVRVHPAVSSVALARARMSWPAETVEVVRVVQPAADEIRRLLTPARRLVVLSRDARTPAAVARVLVDAGFGPSPMAVLSHLGGPQESRRDGLAQRWDDGRPVPDLNLVCVTCAPAYASPLWSSAPGLPDNAYEHDGQLTKRDVRAAALAQLMPVPGQLLWDVGAGAGSVAIEWLRSHPTCRAVAVERDPDRAVRIARNAARLGVPALEVLTGAAPEALRDLPRPDAAFVGGGACGDTLEQVWQALDGGGRLVAHAVTVETEQLLVDQWRSHGGQLTRLSVEQLEPLGDYAGWRPARAVVQWSVQKPLVAP
jgi:precorrin-6Y C5,15-methyltransferase (decarboxylating)